MAVGTRKLCGFVEYTNAVISIQLIFFDGIFWTAMISKFKISSTLRNVAMCFFIHSLSLKLYNLTKND